MYHKYKICVFAFYLYTLADSKTYVHTMPSKAQLISLVIPAYREEKNISLLYKEIQEVLVSTKKYSFEIIFIDAGSSDNTWQEIEKICKKDKNVKWIHLSRNFGHQAALTAGLEKAKGNAIISMDADMQDPVSVAVDMIKKWEKWAEVVYARRKHRNDNFLKKYTALAYYKFLSMISDTQIPRNVWDFRLIDKKVLLAFLSLSEKDRYVRWMFAWLGFKTEFVDFDRPERIHGETGYTWFKMLRLAMDGILNFSMFPLRIGFLIGALMIFVSFLFFLYMFFDAFILGTPYPLFKWLSVFGFGFMWLQFIFIWIVWEYVGRIYNETRDRPIYIISDTVNFK